MSKRKEIIELSAPSRLGKAEKFVSRAQPCSYCRGEGSFTGNNPQGERVPCPDCGGSGKVRALVSVTWVPVTDFTKYRPVGIDTVDEMLNRK